MPTKALKDIGKIYKGSKSTEKKYDPSKQIEGYKNRIAGSGIDAEKAVDTRNPLERALNLREDQNVLFDVFEVINRPQQAIFSAIDAAQTGGDVGKGAIAGFTGNKRMLFKEILHNAGMEDSEGKLGFDDVLGFAGDVFLDPMDIGFMKVNKLAKAAKKFGKADDALKAMNKLEGIARTGDDAQELVYTLYQKQRITSRYEKAQKLLKKAEDLAEKGKHISRVSGTQMTFGLIGSGLRGTFSITDTGLTEMFKLMDRSNFDKLVKFKGKMDDGLKMTTEADFRMLHRYEGIKEVFDNAFNFASKLPEKFMTDTRLIRGKERFVTRLAKTKINDAMPRIKELAFQMSEQSGKPVAEIERVLMVAFERGANLFDKSGNITRQGMRDVFKFGDILTDEGFMLQMGVPKNVADELEAFIRQYAPDVHKKYHSEGSPMFVSRANESTKVVDTYSIKSQEVVEDLRNYFKGIKDPDAKVRVRASILGEDGKKNFDALPENQQKKFVQLEDELNYYLDAHKKGKNSRGVLVKGSRTEKKAREAQQVVDVWEKRVKRLEKKVAVTPPFTADTAKTKKLFDDLDNAKAEYTKALEQHKKVWDEAGEDLVGIRDKIAELRAERARFDEVYGFRTIESEELLKLADGEVSIPSYFTESELANMTELTKLDGFDEALNSMYEVMSSIVKVMEDTMGASFRHQDHYLAHALTSEWKKINVDKAIKIDKKNWVQTKATIGNSQVFAKRRYQASIVEANELSKGYVNYLVETGVVDGTMAENLIKGKQLKMFADDITTSMIDFATKAPKAAGDAQMMSYVLKATLLQENTAIVRFRDQTDIKVPYGFTEVTAETFNVKLQQMSNYLQKGTTKDELLIDVQKFLTANAGKKMFINNNINRLIGRVTDPKETMPLVGLMDSMNNIFKKNKLLSPGFQLRNIVGNINNMWLTGMSVPDILKYNKKAYGIMKKGEDLFTRSAAGEILGVADQKVLNQFNEFIQNGFGELGNALHDIPEYMWESQSAMNKFKAESIYIKSLEDKLKKLPHDSTLKPQILEELRIAKVNRHKGVPKEAYDRLVAFNMRKNQQQDEIFRMSLYMYAKENPQYLIDNGVEDAASAVRRALFDYQDLSVVEQDYMRKLIPFYTFMKKNIGFQMNNLLKNGKKYNQMQKGFNSMWGVLDLEDDELDRFKIENFWIPIPTITADGKYTAIKSSLPLGDLGEFLDNPIQRTLASTAPVFRAPFEIAMNKQVFSGMPIQEFKGQKGFLMPEVPRGVEFGLNQLGFDVPATAAMDIGRTVGGLASGEISNPLEAAQSAVGRTITSRGDAQKTKSRNAYNELDQLEGLMRYYQQEGIDIKTIAELENEGYFKRSRGISERLRALRGK